MPLALPSLSMEMVSLMFLGLIILSRRLNWKNVVFHMRLSPLWVRKVVVCIRSLNVEACFLWIHVVFVIWADFDLILVELAGKSTLLNHLFGTNFREMDAFRGRHVLLFVYFV